MTRREPIAGKPDRVLLMKTLGLLLLAAGAFAAHGPWISLFDGKTLDGWKGFRGPANPVWIVKDGALTVDTADDIVRETLVARGGEVVHPKVREALGLPALVPAGA